MSKEFKEPKKKAFMRSFSNIFYMDLLEGESGDFIKISKKCNSGNKERHVITIPQIHLNEFITELSKLKDNE